MQNRKRLSAEEIDSILGEHQQSLEQYIKPYIHKKVDPITECVYIVCQGDDVYEELREHGARGVCHAENGYIYFRDNVYITANLLIHEFVHRLSRNCINGEWVEGINLPGEGLNYLNEAITEMIASEMTGVREENHPLNTSIEILYVLFEKIAKDDLIAAYFDGDVNFFRNTLGDDYNRFVGSFILMNELLQKANADYGDRDYKSEVDEQIREILTIIISL